MTTAKKADPKKAKFREEKVIRLRKKDAADAIPATCPTCGAGKLRKQADCRLCQGTGEVPVLK